MGAASHHEVELKRLLVGRGAADQFVAALGAPVLSDKQQVNHIFDTEDRRLDRSSFALRLRTEGNYAFLTAKGRTRSVGSNTSSRLEAEVPIEATVAAGILAGRIDPLLALRSRVEDPAFEELWREMETVLGATRIRPWGHFENRRRTIRVTLPQGLCVDVEVDQTRFPDERLDEEIEIELQGDEEVDAVETWLVATTRAAGVETRSSSPKIARFFAALHGPRS